ncbi:MAG: hypothetical protein ABJC62_04970 [Frankiaceae bacterium]
MANTPSSATTFRVTLNGTTTAQGVFAYVMSGPDSDGTLTGTACPPNAGSYVCSVAHDSTNGVGVDTVRFFYDAANTGTYQTGDPNTTAKLTIAGAVNSVTLTPSSANAGVGGYQAFTVTAADTAGRPVPNASVTIAGTEPTALPADIGIRATPPAPGATFTGPGTGTATVTTGDGLGTTTAGAATVYVASKVAGPLTLKATADGSGGIISSTSLLTVNPAGVNDVTSVDVTPGTQNAFTSKPVSATITLRNAQGNPVAGVTPVVELTAGPDASGAVLVAGATNGTGSTTATFATGTTVGTDTVRAYVNQSDHSINTGGLDTGEPRGTASVVVAAEPDFSSPGGLSNGGPFTVPLDTTSVPITFTLKTAATTPAAGYNVAFTTTPSPGAKYSVSPTTGVTDAAGKVVVTVANSTPATGNSVIVTASLVGDPGVTSATSVTWQARQPSDAVITPHVDTAPAKGSTTHTVKVTDQFGDPVTGLTYVWTVTGTRNDPSTNPGATGTGASFTYTDVGPATSGGSDEVSVSAFTSTGTDVADDSVNQYWVVGTAKADQVNVDVNGPNGSYAMTSPYTPSGFEKSANAGVTQNPATGGTADTQQVSVALADPHGDPLYGKTASFTTSGVGVFTDSAGKPLGTSTTTATVDENTGVATVYVRSTQVGIQTVTATVDGISDAATITYSGQYVPVTPRRVVDTRTGQGDVTSSRTLVRNTLYYFYYGSTDMPFDAAAYAFNVTAINPTSAGNLRVGPACGNETVPHTSLINYQKGKDVANFVVIPQADCNSMKIYSDTGNAAVAIDFAGYYPRMGTVPLTAGASKASRTVKNGLPVSNIEGLDPPSRVADTRTGLGGSTGPIAANTSKVFQVSGNGGVAPGAKAVALNITAIDPNRVGNMRVYPDGAALPNTSNINYIVGQDKAAFVVMDLPANGKIRVYSDHASANVAIDAFAYYPATSTLVTSVPKRILDTRDTGSLTANHAMSIPVAGHGGVPADAQAVLVSVTGIHKAGSTGYGNLRVYPTGSGVATVSTLNYVSKTSDVANFDIVQLGTDGELSLYSDSSPIDVAVDVLGYVPAGS